MNTKIQELKEEIERLQEADYESNLELVRGWLKCPNLKFCYSPMNRFVIHGPKEDKEKFIEILKLCEEDYTYDDYIWISQTCYIGYDPGQNNIEIHFSFNGKTTDFKERMTIEIKRLGIKPDILLAKEQLLKEIEQKGVEVKELEEWVLKFE